MPLDARLDLQILQIERTSLLSVPRVDSRDQVSSNYQFIKDWSSKARALRIRNETKYFVPWNILAVASQFENNCISIKASFPPFFLSRLRHVSSLDFLFNFQIQNATSQNWIRPVSTTKGCGMSYFSLTLQPLYCTSSTLRIDRSNPSKQAHVYIDVNLHARCALL